MGIIGSVAEHEKRHFPETGNKYESTGAIKMHQNWV
jgi:hypothetical protein